MIYLGDILIVTNNYSTPLPSGTIVEVVDYWNNLSGGMVRTLNGNGLPFYINECNVKKISSTITCETNNSYLTSMIDSDLIDLKNSRDLYLEKIKILELEIEKINNEEIMLTNIHFIHSGEYYELIDDTKFIFNPKIYSEIEKSCVNDNKFEEGCVVEITAKANLKNSNREISLIRDLNGLESVCFSDALKKITLTEQIKNKYKVNKDVKGDLDYLLLFES